MEFTPLMDRQRQFFRSGVTLDLSRRKQALRDLLREIEAREDELLAALQTDLGKAPFEGYMTEIGLVREEIRYHLKHLDHWARDKRVPTPLSQFPARSIRHLEPYGVVLIMAPWNYPIQLSLEPLIGAISAGNCAVLKPSAYAPACSHALKELISACLPDNWVTVVEGGRAENQALLEQPFDYIFFTGSVAVGRHVMEMAARNLTPVTLELGGKSPVIVTADADLPLAARRIIFGKLLNAGQTCVAPDYLLVDRKVQEKLTELLQQEITHFLGQTPLDAPNYPKIINEKHLHRLEGLLTRRTCGVRRHSERWPHRPHPYGQPGERRTRDAGRDLWPHSAHSPLRHSGGGHGLCLPPTQASGPVPVQPGQGGAEEGAHPAVLRRRLPQRHHRPPHLPPPALRRCGSQRHGCLPRQSQL